MASTFTNPLLRRVQRHRTMSTLFYQGNVIQSMATNLYPTGSVSITSEMPANLTAFGNPVATTVSIQPVSLVGTAVKKADPRLSPALAEIVDTPSTAVVDQPLPLQRIHTTTNNAEIDNGPNIRAEQPYVSDDVTTAPTAEQQVLLRAQTTDPADYQESNWARLQLIMRKHEERFDAQKRVLDPQPEISKPIEQSRPEQLSATENMVTSSTTEAQTTLSVANLTPGVVETVRDPNRELHESGIDTRSDVETQTLKPESIASTGNDEAKLNIFRTVADNLPKESSASGTQSEILPAPQTVLQSEHSKTATQQLVDAKRPADPEPDTTEYTVQSEPDIRTQQTSQPLSQQHEWHVQRSTVEPEIHPSEPQVSDLQVTRASSPVESSTTGERSADLAVAEVQDTIHRTSVEEHLRTLQTGQPSDSVVDVIAPRRPRPRYQARSEGETPLKLPGTETVVQQVPTTQDQRTERQGDHRTMVPESYVTTDIGPLPVDLWRLINEPVPSPMVKQLHDQVEDRTPSTKVGDAPKEQMAVIDRKLHETQAEIPGDKQSFTEDTENTDTTMASTAKLPEDVPTVADVGYNRATSGRTVETPTSEPATGTIAPQRQPETTEQAMSSKTVNGRTEIVNDTATNPAPPLQMLQRQPDVSEVSAPPVTTMEEATDSQVEMEIDTDELARQVFQQLRRKFVIERERMGLR